MKLFLAFILSFLTAFGPVMALAAATRTTQTQQGDGGGIIERNYIQNSNAIANTAGWVTYADGAAYVDGTGGVPTATWTRSTSSPIGGDANFIFTPGTLGDGVSYTIALDPKKKGMWIPISFEYQFTGTTPSDGDVQVMVYDITNSQLIQPAPYKVPALVAGVNNIFVSGFQASSSSTSYRISLYQSTSTSTYTMKAVNFRAGGPKPQLGYAGSDWVAYTPTFSAGFGTVTNINFMSRRDGPDLLIQGIATAGTTTAASATITIGYAGANANVTVGTLPTVNTSNYSSVGEWHSNTASAGGIPALASTTDSLIRMGLQGSSSGLQSINASSVVPTSGFFSLSARVPIAGWSSNVILGGDGDTRLVAMEAGLTSAVTPGANAVLKYDTVIQDTHSCYSVTTGLCTIPVSGTYRISITCLATAATTNLYIVVSGAAKGVITTCDAGVSRGGSISYPFTAGQTVGIFQETSAAMAATSGSLGFFNRVSIEKVSGPSTIAANETVSARYHLASNTSMTASGPINFDTKDFDSHNAVTTGAGTWKFTAPSAGIYLVVVPCELSASTTNVRLYKNAVADTYIASYSSTAIITGSTTVKLVAGDTIAVYTDSTVTFLGVASSTNLSTISITKVAN